MARNDTVSFEFEARIEAFKREIGKIPGITAKESRAMVAEWKKGQKAIEKQASRSARAAAREYERGMDNIKGSAERTASLLGGTFADISDVFLDLGERVGTASTSLGGCGGAAVAAVGGVTALGLAAGFLGTAAWEAGGAALEARDRLHELGLEDGLSPEAAANMDAFKMAAEASALQADLAAVAIGSKLAPSLTLLSNAAVGAMNRMDGLNASFTETEVLGRSVSSWVGDPLGAYALMEGALTNLAEEGEQVNRVLMEQRGEFENFKEGNEKLAKEVEEHQRLIEAAHRKATQAAAQQRKEMERYASQIQDGLDGIGDVAGDTQQAVDKLFGTMEAQRLQAIRDGWQGVTDQLAEAGAAADKLAATGAALDQTYSQAFRSIMNEYRDAGLELLDAGLGFAQQEFAAKADQRMEEARQIKEQGEAEAQRKAEASRAEIQRRLQEGKVSKEQSEAQLKAVDAREKAEIRAARKEARERRKLAMKAFRAHKTASIAEATANAAVAGLQAATVNPPPSPLLPIALGAIATQLATSIASIRRQKPPQFPTGYSGDSDHPMMAYLQTGEPVLNRRAARAIGGPEGAAALNRGEGLPSAGTVIENLIIQLDPRETRKVLAGERTTIPMGRIDPHRGGKRG